MFDVGAKLSNNFFLFFEIAIVLIALATCFVVLISIFTGTLFFVLFLENFSLNEKSSN